MTHYAPASAAVVEPRSRSFRVTNAFQWVLDAHHSGFSEADIRFVLDVLGWTEPICRALAADAAKRTTS